MKQLPKRRLLSVQESSAYVGVSPSTIRRWKDQRLIPFYKVGARVLFDPADLDAFLAASRVEAVDAWA